MTLHEVATRIGELEALDQVTQPLARAAKKVIPAGPVKDVLSGTPLGHPLHPVLTDVAIGAFTGATVLDLFGKSRSEDAVDLLLAVRFRRGRSRTGDASSAPGTEASSGSTTERSSTVRPASLSPPTTCA